MAAVSTFVAIAAVVIGGLSYVSAEEARADAKEANMRSAEEQRKAKAEQGAINAQQQAQERRNQIREERVRRAKIIQSSENTGTSYSSGELGATGGLSTQLGNNIGQNVGRAAAGERIGQFNQNAADWQLNAQNASSDAQSAGGMFQLATSAFSSAGGFGTLKSAYGRMTAPAPV